MTILMDGLVPAFMELRAIRAPETAKLPLAERFQPYEDFARKLWKAYKDLTQRAAEAMGFDIGFLYQKDTKFDEGLSKFRSDWPALHWASKNFCGKPLTSGKASFRRFGIASWNTSMESERILRSSMTAR